MLLISKLLQRIGGRIIEFGQDIDPRPALGPKFGPKGA